MKNTTKQNSSIISKYSRYFTLDLENFISEGYIIAIIPFLVYFLSIGFNDGFFSYFGIPDVFIDLTANAMYIAIAILIGCLWIIVASYIVLAMNRQIHTRKWNKVIWKICISIAIMSLLFHLFNSLFLKTKPLYYFSQGLWGINMLIFSLAVHKGLILPIRILRNKFKLAFIIFDVLVISAGILISGYYISATIGSLNAITKIKYYVYESNPEMAILYLDKDIIICSEYNKKLRTIDSTLIIIDISSNSPIRLHKKKIGPLKPIRK